MARGEPVIPVDDPQRAGIVGLAERDQRRQRGRDLRARLGPLEQALLREARVDAHLRSQKVAQVERHKRPILRRRRPPRLGGPCLRWTMGLPRPCPPRGSTGPLPKTPGPRSRARRRRAGRSST